jgi:hypothetical protein
MDNSYYDDGGYEDWCEANQDLIVEQYILEIEDDFDEDDLKGKIYLEQLTYEQVPSDFKEKMFEEYLEHGGEQA